jgi:hypothetical protein
MLAFSSRHWYHNFIFEQTNGTKNDISIVFYSESLIGPVVRRPQGEPLGEIEGTDPNAIIVPGE